MSQCPRCGTNLREGAVFCDTCGSMQIAAAAPPSDAPPIAFVPPQYPQYQPPPPAPPPENRRVDSGGIIEGLIMVIGGVILIIAGLLPEMSCSIVHVLGGQCYTFLGYTYIEPAFQIVPAILLGFGVLFILVGGIMAARRTQK